MQSGGFTSVVDPVPYGIELSSPAEQIQQGLGVPVFNSSAAPGSDGVLDYLPSPCKSAE
jgi:hypothetical protein